MPLEILVVLVVLGVGGVVVATWWLGWAKAARLTDGAGAARQFNLDYPELRVASVAMSEDQSAALLKLETADVVGLVFAFGDKFVTRRLTPALLRTINIEQNDTVVRVSLRLADITAPEIDLVYTPGNYAQSVEALLAALQTAREAA